MSRSKSNDWVDVWYKGSLEGLLNKAQLIIDDLRTQCEATEKLIAELRHDLMSIASMTIFDGGTKTSYGLCYEHAVNLAGNAIDKIDAYLEKQKGQEDE
jgi:hypothetical protein